MKKLLLIAHQIYINKKNMNLFVIKTYVYPFGTDRSIFYVRQFVV